MHYFLVFLLLLVAELLYFRVADRFDIIDKPNERSSHTRITLRGGGFIFLLGIWLYSVFYGFLYPWFLAGLTAIAGISFADDVHSVPNKCRLMVHFAAMFLMFEDFGILNAGCWWTVLPGLVFCVGILNAYNFMDGINGMTGGYSLAVLLPLLFVNRTLAFIDEHFLVVSVLSVLVFCLFNFRRKARCFAGDVGAMGIAFIILFALGKMVLQTENFVYLLFLAVYGVDSVLTIIHRIMLHEHLGKAHRKHVYQLMANELKMSHVSVSFIYMMLQLLISFGLLFLPVSRCLYFGGILLLLIIVYVLFKRRYYHLHEKYLKSKEV